MNDIHCQAGSTSVVEALESRSLLSGEIDHGFAGGGLLNVRDAGGAAVTQVMMAVQSDGRIVVAGASSTNTNTAVVRRYLANGTPDWGFGTNGISTIPNVRASTLDKLTVLADGRIQVVGYQAVRLTPLGKLDPTFGGGDGIAPSVLAADRRASDFIFPDGSYVELSNGGLFFSGGRVKLFRHKADGTIDTSFGGGKGYFDLTSRYSDILKQGAVTADTAGRIYVSFASGDNELPDDHVLRLTAAGQVDGTWGTGGLASTGANWDTLFGSISILADGRVILLGVEPSEDGVAVNDLIFFSKTGQSTGISPVGPADTFFPTQVVQDKTGKLFLGGFYYDGVDPFSTFGLSYSAVLSVNSNFATNTSFSPDHDGIGGFRLASQDTGFGGLQVTPDGDLLLLGNDRIVRLEGPTKSNKTSATFSNTVLTLQGSGGSDHFLATTTDEFDFSFPNSTVAYLDNNGGYVSADHVAIDNTVSTVSRVVMNLNGSDDRGDARGLLLPASITGGAGRDVIYGPLTIGSTLRGGDGDDSLNGGSGDDWIYGDAGADVIHADGGTNHIFP